MAASSSLQHAADGPAPSGMGRGNDPGFGIREQHGAQSAVSTPSARPGVAVAIASARGRSPALQALSTTMAVAL